MAAKAENSPLLNSAQTMNYSPFKRKIAYGSAAVVGLVGTVISGYNLLYSRLQPSGPCDHPSNLLGDIFGTLGCLSMTLLAGKELFARRDIQPVAPTTNSTTGKTDNLGQSHLQQLQTLVTQLDALLAILHKNESNLVQLDIDAPTLDSVIGDLKARIISLETTIRNPDKKYIISLFEKVQITLSTHNSASNSTNITPTHNKRLSQISSLSNTPRGPINIDFIDLITKLQQLGTVSPTISPTASPLRQQGGTSTTITPISFLLLQDDKTT